MRQMKTVLFAAMAIFVSAAASAQSGYQVRSGDILSVEVVQDPSLNREVLVLPNGTINFPFAGAVPATGRSPSQLQGTIANAIAENFQGTPDVFVTVRQVGEPVFTGAAAPATMDVYFLGEVASPGLAQVPHGATLLQALALSGGFTNFAADRRIQLRRTDRSGQTSLVTLDYRALSDGGVLTNDPVLADGDVILVPERRLFE